MQSSEFLKNLNGKMIVAFDSQKTRRQNYKKMLINKIIFIQSDFEQNRYIRNVSSKKNCFYKLIILLQYKYSLADVRLQFILSADIR